MAGNDIKLRSPGLPFSYNGKGTCYQVKGKIVYHL